MQNTIYIKACFECNLLKCCISESFNIPIPDIFKSSLNTGTAFPIFGETLPAAKKLE